MNTTAAATRRAMLALPGLLTATLSRAQAPWPDRPVRLLIGYPPGGPTDFIGRLAAAGLQAAWGQTVVVENRAGASSSVAAEVVSRAAPDGLTLFFASNAVVLNAVVHPSLPYALPDSFAPVGTFCTAPNVFWCAANQPWRDLEAVAAAARAQPGTLAYGTTGVGGTGHFGGETSCRALGISLTHVPCAAPRLDAGRDRRPRAAAGPWDGGRGGPLPGGAMRPLAILGPKRAPELPEVPTMAELGRAVPDSGVWSGGVGPSKHRRLRRRAWRTTWRHSPAPPIPARSSPPRPRCADFVGAEFATRIGRDFATWQEIARSVGIKAE